MSEVLTVRVEKEVGRRWPTLPRPQQPVLLEAKTKSALAAYVLILFSEDLL